MKLTGTGSSLNSLLVLFCLGIQYGILDAKAIKKSKHGVHKSGSKKNNAPKGNFCVNHSYCVKYSDWDCASEWVQLNCPRMCRLCEYEGPNILKLPAVLYYKKGDKKHGISGKTKHHKGKHSSKAKLVEKRDEGDRRDVVFLSKPYGDTPTKAPSKLQTTSYPIFDYQSNHRNWLFLFPDQHPVNLKYVDQGKVADPNQQSTGQQQAGATQDAAGAPVAAAGAAPTIAPATSTVDQLAAQPAAPSVTQPAATAAAQPVSLAAAAPVVPVAAQPVAPAVATPAAPAVAPALPQVGQAAAAAVASQQSVAEEPGAAITQPLESTQTTFTNQTQVTAPGSANQTIELLNQTFTLATNETQQPSVGMGAVGFEPTEGNITETNQTVMAGVYQPHAQGYGTVNNTSNQTVAAGTMDLTTTGQSFTQDVTADSDGAAQTPWTCCNKNVKPPKDCKPCPKLPKAPPMPYVFNVYCDDVYKDCAYGYSNCNDTWWEINCPKTCGLCKAKDKVNVPTTKQVLPTEVKDLENTELESDLVAPVPGDKPLVAKYTLRVKPKLVNGVPQMQEIRIMPPNKASGFVKPLMVLKQNITKPMIENIEIDVPRKGAKFSRKPSVEVIEGDHKEMLQVHRGQALVEDPVQKSEIKPEEIKEATPTNKTEDSTMQAQSASTTKTEQNKAAANTTEQTDSSSTNTTEQDSANETSTAQTSTPSKAETATQSDSNQSDNQSQSSAPSSQTAAYSTTETCTDDSRCATYIETQCGDPWLKANCKSKCKLC